MVNLEKGYKATLGSPVLSGCQHPIIRNIVTERHNIAGRLITKAKSKGLLGSCLVFIDVGSADKHRM